MLTTHRIVAFLVLAATWGAAVLAGIAYYRRREPRGLVTHMLALAQTLLVARSASGSCSSPTIIERRTDCTTSTGRWLSSPPSRRGSTRPPSAAPGWPGLRRLLWWQERSRCGRT